MKNIALLAVLFVALACWRCSDDDDKTKACVVATISVSDTTLEVPMQGGEYVLDIEADERWSAVSSMGWCSLTRNLDNNTLTVQVKRSGSTQERAAVITVSAGTEAAKTISVTQAAITGRDEPMEYDGYTLAWSNEFNTDGTPDASIWDFENGFVRNEELQWYQADNATCKDGFLVITGEKVSFPNPNYEAGSSDWKKNRETVEYTSTSMTTGSSYNFKYGRLEVRAKIPTAMGAWPAIWTLGNWWEWPCSGEIDVLEYYLVGGVPSIHANICWGSDKRWSGMWDSYNRPLSEFVAKNENWEDEFHIWRMDWDEEYLRLYLDDELLNEHVLWDTWNRGGGINNWDNPFKNDYEGQGQYILLNLAIGNNGGIPDDAAFPLKYQVDYVRVYQKTN